MSLSIPTAALIHGATRIAGEVALRARQAFSFDDVLRGNDPASTDVPPSQSQVADINQQIDKLTAAIHKRLRQLGFDWDVNRPLPLSVQPGGQLRVEGDHAHAARIEASLNADPLIGRQANDLVRTTGDPVGISIPRDLTSTIGGENILQSPGGYPNW